jgi:hypothetical protein
VKTWSHGIQAVAAVGKFHPQGQTFETAWQGHTIQAAVELLAKGQVLKTVGQRYPIEALVEKVSKS